MPAQRRSTNARAAFAVYLLLLAAASLRAAADPDVLTIIQRSVEANNRDFAAASHFNYKERDKKDETVKAVQVDMIDGSPYERPLESSSALELRKEEQAQKRRIAESPQARRQRIARYERDRHRDDQMMSQLTQAFNFKLTGTASERGFDVYVLKAVPKPGYRPPNIEARVLPGMQGELWIDKKTFQWVKVTAEVVRPVAIEGFLARVEPGTRFEVEKTPVGDGSVWMVSHFSMKASAKLLGLFNHNSAEDDTLWDYTPSK
jgi:hypothetical protein